LVWLLKIIDVSRLASSGLVIISRKRAEASSHLGVGWWFSRVWGGRGWLVFQVLEEVSESLELSELLLSELCFLALRVALASNFFCFLLNSFFLSW